MLRILLKLFGEKEQHYGTWAHIGSIAYGNITGDIPNWVLSEEKRIKRKYGGTSSSLIDKAFYLKGHHFEYRITYSGQGGAIVEIERRKR